MQLARRMNADRYVDGVVGRYQVPKGPGTPVYEVVQYPAALDTRPGS